jgi:hypothetical protein
MKAKISILTLSLITFLIGMQFDFTSVKLDNTGENFNHVFCSENSNYSEKQNKDMLFSEPSFDNEYISCIDSEKTINGATETYHFMTTCKIDTILSAGKIELSSFKINEEEIECTLSNFLNNESINLQFYDNNILVDNVTIYFASNNFGTFFSSSFSLDTAKRNACQTLNYTLINDENVSNENVEISPLGIGVTGNTSGTFKWTDDQGNVHPLIGAKVKITIGGSWWSSTTYTNQEGYYSFSYNDIWYIGSGKPTITIYADNGELISVSNGGTYAMSKEMSGSSGNFSWSYTFSPVTDGDMGKSIIIFQAAKSFADYAKSMNGGSPITFCTFNYPGDPNYGSSYNGNNVVTITSKPRDDSSLPNSYSSWDVIGHEYGHHVQKCYGITANPGGIHYVGHNNIDDQYDTKDSNGNRIYTLEESKERGLKLAWGEGWPTYWSTIAQFTFSADLKTIPTVGDTWYTSYNGVKYNLDSYSNPYAYNPWGDADEIAIQQFLYKLSSSETDQFDKFSIDSNTLWNITIENKPHTFYEFINDLYDDGYNRYDLGTLLAKYSIAVSNITISNNYLDECPTFTWSTDMGSDYLHYNNFDLVFLNPRGQEVLRKNNIITTGETGSYTLTKSEWASIISVYGRTYYAYIVARQTLSFTSGNYYSELFEFTEPDDFNRKVQIKPNEWGFEPQYFFESNKEGHTTTTITDHGLTINTNRLRCGYIENSYVILSPKRENAGKAYLELYFDKPVYSYMFGITLWSNKEGLSSADCTAVVEVMDANGNWSIDMDLFRDLPNGFSIKTQQIDRYEIACRNGIYGLRFVMTSPATGDRNKGRLCLDDIVLNTDPNDLWFISTFYE